MLQWEDQIILSVAQILLWEVLWKNHIILKTQKNQKDQEQQKRKEYNLKEINPLSINMAALAILKIQWNAYQRTLNKRKKTHYKRKGMQ